MQLLATQPTEHRLELARGKMSARIWAPPRLFFVDTPSAVAADLGCAYTLEVDDDGGSVLHVTSGWVALQLKDRESMVPAGAACETQPGIGPGTPYFVDATPVFREALQEDRLYRGFGHEEWRSEFDVGPGASTRHANAVASADARQRLKTAAVFTTSSLALFRLRLVLLAKVCCSSISRCSRRGDQTLEPAWIGSGKKLDQG